MLTFSSVNATSSCDYEEPEARGGGSGGGSGWKRPRHPAPNGARADCIIGHRHIPDADRSLRTERISDYAPTQEQRQWTLPLGNALKSKTLPRPRVDGVKRHPHLTPTFDV